MGEAAVLAIVLLLMAGVAALLVRERRQLRDARRCDPPWREGGGRSPPG